MRAAGAGAAGTAAEGTGGRPGAEDVESRPLSRRTKLVIGIALGASILVLAVFPFALMTLPDPRPYRLDSLAGERSGTFVAVHDGYYKLYPYSAPLFSFPTDALVVETAQPMMVVKFRQSNSLALYALTRYGAGVVTLNKVPMGETALQLAPAEPLEPGEYVLTAPRDSVDEQIDNFYFRVPG